MTTFDERIEIIANHYGFEHQCKRAIEELAELIVALKHIEKLDENIVDYYINLATELADAKIMIDQLIYLFNNDKSLVEINDGPIEQEIDYKLDRQLFRIKTGIEGAELP